MAQARGNEVERKIYFYRADAGRDAAGVPQAFNPEPILRHINSLPFTPAGRYMDSSEGSVICCWVDRATANQRLRLAHVRRSGLPQLERGGQVSALEIPIHAGLAEAVHVVFFPDRIVGSEFNFFGPRVSRLGRYICAKADNFCTELTFRPILRQDAAAQLARLRDVRMLDLKIRASDVDIVAQADEDLGAAFSAAQRATEAEEVEIILRPKAYSRAGRLAARVLPAVRRLARRQDIHESASRFVVTGHDPDSQLSTVDILSDHLVSRKQILLQDARTRALNSNSAYAAIEEAYAELRAELRAAPDVE